MTKSIQKWLVLGMILPGIAAASTAEATQNCNPQEGKQIFGNCEACHSLTAGIEMQGPSLHGLFGRKAGTVAGFHYSKTMTSANFVWNEKTFKAFIENPAAYVKGTRMPFGGLHVADDRNDLYCYLKGLN